MKTPKSIRGPSTERTLETLKKDYEGLVAAGGNIQLAKKYHNVIHPYFFEIPLDQVYTNAFDLLHVYNYNYMQKIIHVIGILFTSNIFMF